MAHSGQEDVGDSAGSDPWPFGPPATPLREGNGFGGFPADGHEYAIDLAPGQATPAPWPNVLAHPRFGRVASESKTGYTWAENAHEFRLTHRPDGPAIGRAPRWVNAGPYVLISVDSLTIKNTN